MREEDAGEDPVAAAEEKLHAIQRGFLTTVKSPPAVTGDIGEFLDTTARKVMEQASELMAKEGPETTPFKYKYEARELLVGSSLHVLLSAEESPRPHSAILFLHLMYGHGRWRCSRKCILARAGN